MASRWRQLLTFIWLLLPLWAAADEGIDKQGRRFFGILQTKNFLLTKSDKTLTLDQLHLVQFPEHPAPLPSCMLAHQLLLPGEQRLTGALLDIGAKDARFRIVTGETLTLPRDKLQGILQADGRLIQWTEDFEGKETPNVWLGKPIFSHEHVYSGKKSLLVDASAGETTLAIAAGQTTKTARRLSLHFFDPGLTETAAAKIQFGFEAPDAKIPSTLLLNHQTYRQEMGFSIKAQPGWHLVQVDWHDGEARTHLDDFFLGSQRIPKLACIRAVSFSLTGKGSLWFDSLYLTEQAPPLKRAPGPPDLDEIWLASGDQIFGKLLQADELAIALDAPFGKRSYSWSDVRGIFFRAGGKQPSLGQAVEVRFRSGPGVSADLLAGNILDLNDKRLVLRHAVLGEFSVARTRLERIRLR